MTAVQFTRAWIRSHMGGDRGASLIEYALLLVLIVLVAIGAVAALGNGTSSRYSDIASQLG